MLFSDASLVDEFQAELDEIKAKQAKLHARQLVILNQLERAGVAHRSGARTMAEWTATRLDVTAGAAKELVAAANRLGRTPWLFDELAAGRLSLERAMATVRLEASDAPMSVVDRSFELDLAAITRLTHKYRRMRRSDERRVFADRHFVIQPSLDESRWRMWGELPGKDGRIVDQALSERADEMRRLPGGDYFTKGQRQADALAEIAQDSLSRSHNGVDSAAGPEGVVFVDLDLANGTGGELGAEIEYGPRAKSVTMIPSPQRLVSRSPGAANATVADAPNTTVSREATRPVLLRIRTSPSSTKEYDTPRCTQATGPEDPRGATAEVLAKVPSLVPSRLGRP